MQITNTGAAVIPLSAALSLLPNSTTAVPNWDDFKDNAIVKAWIKAGIIKVEQEQERTRKNIYRRPPPIPAPEDEGPAKTETPTADE